MGGSPRLVVSDREAGAVHSEAEPLLIEECRGMKARETSIEPDARKRIPQSLDRRVRLYEATRVTDAAATWRRELDAAKSGPPAPPGR